MEPKPNPRLTLVTPFESRAGQVTRIDPGLINAYAEKDEEGEHRVYKRPGTKLQVTNTLPPSYTPVWSLGTYAVINSNLVPGLLSFVVGVSGGIQNLFLIGGGVINTGLVMPATSAAAASASVASVLQYLVNPSRIAFNVGFGSPYVQVCDALGNYISASAPNLSNPLVPGIVELDSTIYVMDVYANIYGSALNDATTFPPLNILQLTKEPGLGVYLAKHHDYVAAFKSFSIEFAFDNNNATGSPLSPVANSTILVGCVDAATVQSIGDRIFWLAREKTGSNYVAVLENMQLAKISTPGIDKILASAQAPFVSFAYRAGSGHLFYGITNQAQGWTLVFDISEKLWYLWNSAIFAYFPYKVIAAPTGQNLIVATSTTNANALSYYQINETFPTDAEGLFPVDIYTPNNDFGTRRRKTAVRQDIISDQQPGFLLSRWSDDDFASFSEFRRIDLNRKRPQLTNCGTFRRRAYHYRYQSPYQLRIEAVEFELLLGI